MLIHIPEAFAYCQVLEHAKKANSASGSFHALTDLELRVRECHLGGRGESLPEMGERSPHPSHRVPNTNGAGRRDRGLEKAVQRSR